MSETQEEDRHREKEREMHVGRVILDVGEYLLCGREATRYFSAHFCVKIL